MRLPVCVVCLAGSWFVVAAGLRPFGPAIFETGRFTLALIFLFLVPGRVILNLAGPGLNRFERGVLSVPMGLFALGSTYYLYDVNLAGLPGAPSLAAFSRAWAVGFAALALVSSRGRWREMPREISLDARFVSLVLLTASLFPILARCAFVNGEVTERGVLFALDDFSHFSLMGEFLRPGPTLGPYLSGFPFPPHNLLNAAVCGAILSFTRIDPVHLFCLYCPTLYFGLVALTGYAAFRRLSRSHAIGLFAAFLLFYSGDYLLPLAVADEPHNGLAFVFLLGGLAALAAARSRASWRAALVAGVLFGGIFHSKAPAFPAVVAALGIDGFAGWLRGRRTTSLIAVAAACSVALVSLLGFASPGEMLQSTIRIAPGRTFVECFTTWAEEVKALGPAARLFERHLWIAFAASVAVVLALGLNWRLVSLPMLARRIRARRPLTSQDVLLAALFLVGLSLTLALFNPDARRSNVPFWPFFFTGPPLAAFAAAWALRDWARRTTRRRAGVGLVLFFLPAAVLGIVSFTGEDERAGFPLSVYRMAVFLREQTAPGDVILHDPEAAGLCWFSLRPSVLAAYHVLQGAGDLMTVGQGYRKNLFQTVERRRADIARFFETDDAGEARSILERYGVRSVVVLPGQTLRFPSIGLLEPVYDDSEEARVWRVQVQPRALAGEAGRPL